MDVIVMRHGAEFVHSKLTPAEPTPLLAKDSWAVAGEPYENDDGYKEWERYNEQDRS